MRNEGLIETRQGVGAFVTEPDRRQAIRIEPETLADRDHFQSLFQLRMALEIEAAGLAAVHHTAEDMSRLDEALAEMTGREKWTDEGSLPISLFTGRSQLPRIMNISRLCLVS